MILSHVIFLKYFFDIYWKDVSASYGGTVVLCKLIFEASAWLVQGIGSNQYKTVYPEGNAGNFLKATPFVVGDLQMNSLFCGFTNCFTIQESNKAIIWSWYWNSFI